MVCPSRSAAREWYSFIQFCMSTTPANRAEFVCSDTGEFGFSFTVADNSGWLQKVVSELKEKNVLSLSVSVGGNQ